MIKFILSKLGLYAANVVYASGGGFYILAPNTQTIKDKLDHLEQTISRKIFETHGESLYLAIDSIPNSEKQILNKTIGSQWRELIEKVNQRKRQKYRYDLIDRYDEFFKPTGIGAQQTRDAITGEEILEGEAWKYLVKGEDSKVKGITHDQIELGKTLKNAVYWLTTNTKLKELKAFDPAYLGVYHYLLTREDLKKIDWSHIRNNPFNEIRLINELDFHEKNIPTANLIWGFEFYGGNNYPVFSEDVVDSDGNIIHKTGDSKSYQYFGGEGNFQRIGMLRMDVDNLGQIFVKGFKDENRTYSRYSTLSRSLDYFFKGYISRLWEQEKYNECSSIIYAGGDDLFIVGKWDRMIQMAKEIKAAFSEWTCQNPNLTLSGGIGVVPVKFPVMRGAKEAGGDEDSAKNHKVNNGNGTVEKSSFTIFKHPLHWEMEYPVVENYKERIKEAVETKDGLAHSFFTRIYNFYEYAGIKQHEITNLKVLWMIAYEFGRLAQTVKSSHARKLLKDCQKGIYTNSIDGQKNTTSYHFLELLNVAARWAELEIRTYKH